MHPFDRPALPGAVTACATALVSSAWGGARRTDAFVEARHHPAVAH
jgi:hypothetical protein